MQEPEGYKIKLWVYSELEVYRQSLGQSILEILLRVQGSQRKVFYFLFLSYDSEIDYNLDGDPDVSLLFFESDEC